MATSKDREDLAEALRRYAEFSESDDLAILLCYHDNVFNLDFLRQAREIADNTQDDNLFKLVRRLRRVMEFGQDIPTDEDEPPTPENAGANAILGGHPPTAQMTGTSVSTRPDHTPQFGGPQPIPPSPLPLLQDILPGYCQQVTCPQDWKSPLNSSFPFAKLQNANKIWTEILERTKWGSTETSLPQDGPSLDSSGTAATTGDAASVEAKGTLVNPDLDSCPVSKGLSFPNAFIMLTTVQPETEFKELFYQRGLTPEDPISGTTDPGPTEQQPEKASASLRHTPITESTGGNPLQSPKKKSRTGYQAFTPSEAVNFSLQDSEEFLKRFSHWLHKYAEDTHSATLAVQLQQMDPKDFISKPDLYVHKMSNATMAVEDISLTRYMMFIADELCLFLEAWDEACQYANKTQNKHLSRLLHVMYTKAQPCSLDGLKRLVLHVGDPDFTKMVRDYEAQHAELCRQANIMSEESSDKTSEHSIVKTKELTKDTRSEDSQRDKSSAKNQAKDLHSGDCTEEGALPSTVEDVNVSETRGVVEQPGGSESTLSLASEDGETLARGPSVRGTEQTVTADQRPEMGGQQKGRTAERGHTDTGPGSLPDNMAPGQHAGAENASRDPGSQSHSGLTALDLSSGGPFSRTTDLGPSQQQREAAIAPPRYRPRVIESMAVGPLLSPEDSRLGNRQAFKPSQDFVNLNLQDSQEFLQTFSRRLEMYAEDTHNDTLAVQMMQLDPAELASRPESYIAKMREVARAVGDSRLHSIVDLTSDELDLLKMAWKMVRDYAAKTRNFALGIIRYMNSKSSFCSFRCLKHLVSDVEDPALMEEVRQYADLLRELHKKQNAIIRLEEASEETSQEDCCTVEQKRLPKDARNEDSLRDKSSAKDQVKDLHSGDCTEEGALPSTAQGPGTLLDNMASGQHVGTENASRDPGSQSHSSYTTSDYPKKPSDHAAEEEPPSLSAMMKELVTCIKRHAERTQKLSLMELVSDVSVPDHPDIQDLTSICLRCLAYAERSQNGKLFSNLLVVYSEVHFDALMDMLQEYVEHSTDDRLKTALSDVPLAWETIERVAHELDEETLKMYILLRHNTVEMLLEKEKIFPITKP
ncbi:hypothetical protein ACOMHN_029656 [Nucella lapillus]